MSYYGQEFNYSSIQKDGSGNQARPDKLYNIMPAPSLEHKLRRRPRKRMNAVPMLLCLFIPWALFSITYWVLSSPLRQEQPSLCFFVGLIGFLLVMTAGCCATEGRMSRGAFREPSWFLFLFITGFVAWVAAMILSGITFHYHTVPNKMMKQLNTYTYVDPAFMKGTQVMDAGVVMFVPGTKLDLPRTMAFRNNKMYCAVPITRGNNTLYSYDFWAVGTDCCSSQAADFHCAGFNSKEPRAVRLLSDNQRPFYRLAVQQAEARYGIRAVHPLFFEWGAEAPSGPDVSDQMAELATKSVGGAVNFTKTYFLYHAVKNFRLIIFAHFIWQSILVIGATLFFAKHA